MQLWERIVGWNQSDPSVLSSDVDVHLQRMLQGGYAYIHSREGSAVARLKNCHLALIGEKDAPSTNINIALRKNSAYRKLFQDV